MSKSGSYSAALEAIRVKATELKAKMERGERLTLEDKLALQQLCLALPDEPDDQAQDFNVMVVHYAGAVNGKVLHIVYDREDLHAACGMFIGGYIFMTQPARDLCKACLRAAR